MSSNKESDAHATFNFLIAMLVVIALISIWYVSSYLGFIDGQKALQKEAVKAGAATWVVSQEGAVSFEWKKEDEK